MESIKHYLFPSLILEKHDLNFPAVKSAVQATIFQHMKNGFSSEETGHVDLHLDGNFKQLFEFASSAISDYISTFAADPEIFDWYVVKSWANIIKNRGNPTHNHADAHLSFVYYINIPSEIETPIIFHNNPNRYEPFHGFSRWNSKSFDVLNSGIWKFVPVEGQILVFPAAMAHETPRVSNTPDPGVKDYTDLTKHRFSIAGDVIITYKDPTANPLGLQPITNWRKF